jgi:hypothetical protein
MDQAGQQNLRQLDQNAVVTDIDYDRVEYLRIAGLQLQLEKFQLFHFHGVDFGFGGVAFRV